MAWKTLLTYITGTVDQELLVRNEYLMTENRIRRRQLQGRIRLNDGERKALAEIGQKLRNAGCARSKRSACRGSSCLGKPRFAMC
jgi:hypothetical protein